MEPLPTKEEIAAGKYPKWDGNGSLEKEMLRYLGLPEDFHPTPEQAMHIAIAAMED